jgi:AbrB family looped-hinge helix DNA binding protein
MEVTRLSDEGQVIIPASLQAALRWKAGQELVVINMGDGILLKPKKPFAETSLEQVAGCLSCIGQPKTLENMENAISQGLLSSNL